MDGGAYAWRAGPWRRPASLRTFPFSLRPPSRRLPRERYDALLADHRRAGDDCRARVGDKDREIEGLRTDLERALNSSDNFREAATRNDRTRTRLKAAEKERQLIVQECRGKAQDIFEHAAVQRAISDGNGRFEFEGVEPGRYGVVALESSGEKARSWSFECLIAGAEARVLDPAANRAGFEADWGLR